MKNISKVLFVGSAIVLSAASVASAFAAAQPNLYNGGLGQVATDAQRFGVAVCNRGSSALTQVVPVTVAANGQTAQISSAASIAAGKCEYTYLAYSDLGMQPRAKYSVTVTVNGADQSTYDITVPAGTTASAKTGSSDTANANQQSGNIFVIIGRWFLSLFGIK